MSIIKPPVLPAWADAGDKIQPTNAEVATGWPLSNIPPSRQRFNWILNFLANGIRYFSRRGLPDYDPAETYMIGDRIIGDDGKTYVSIVDNNTGRTPTTTPNSWEIWGFSQSQADARYALKTQGGNLTVRLVDTVGLTAAGLAIIDGVQTVAGDLVLRSVGTDQANIVYVVGAGNWEEYKLANIKAGTILSVQEGAQNADTIWELKTDGIINIGTTPLNWADITASIRAAITAEATARAAADAALSTAITAEAAARANAIVAIPAPKGLGMSGETWHNLTGERVFNTTYTNTFPYPIAVSASATCAVTSVIRGYVDGVLVSFFQWQFNGCGSFGGAFIIVPPGSTYQLDSGQGVHNWVELYKDQL